MFAIPAILTQAHLSQDSTEIVAKLEQRVNGLHLRLTQTETTVCQHAGRIERVYEQVIRLTRLPSGKPACYVPCTASQQSYITSACSTTDLSLSLPCHAMPCLVMPQCEPWPSISLTLASYVQGLYMCSLGLPAPCVAATGTQRRLGATSLPQCQTFIPSSHQRSKQQCAT